MKKMIGLYLTIMILLLVIFGCEKQNDTDALKDYLIIDTLSQKYDFSIEINREVYSDYYSNDTNSVYYLDVNNDGIKDIKFRSSSAASPGGLNQTFTTIETLNLNISLATIEKVDTFCTYTRTHDSINFFHYNENYEFDKVYNNTLELQINTNLYPEILNENDTIDANNYWNQGGYYLSYANNSHAGAPGPVRYITSIYKGIWSGVDKKFIGLKFIDGNNLYMGWLKLGVNYNKIFLYKMELSRLKNNN